LKDGLKVLGGPNIPGFAIAAGCMLFAFDGTEGREGFKGREEVEVKGDAGWETIGETKVFD